MWDGRRHDKVVSAKRGMQEEIKSCRIARSVSWPPPILSVSSKRQDGRSIRWQHNLIDFQERRTLISPARAADQQSTNERAR